MTPANGSDRTPQSPVPIGDYGLIGDTRTGALVAPDGAIDWMCVPRFDGDPVFGRLVGGTAAGSFRMAAAGEARVTARRYRGGSATLETTWGTPTGRLTLTEGMVSEVEGRLLPTTLLVRRLEAVGGPVEAVVEFDPRLGEHLSRPRWRQQRGLLVCSWGATAVSLRATPPLRVEPGRAAHVIVHQGRPVTIAMGVASGEPLVDVDPTHAWALLREDERAWQAWTREIDARVPGGDAVRRSLITLRLLTYSPSGAPVAAPTTSLPEEVGGERNWDYRYAWPRDASIGVAAFLAVGNTGEAHRFFAWLLHASRLDRPRLPVLFSIHGRRPRPERAWQQWPGYAGSRPVRVGNAAAAQHQLDGYGWVLDAAWALTRSGHALHIEAWRAVRAFADEVARRWRDPDAGIWEVRGDDAHHVHSKLMAWLALDRALRIAQTRRTPRQQVARWGAERDALHAEVTRRGFDTALGCYTRTYGSRELDAALLVLPLIGIEEPGSPRVTATVDAVRTHLGAGGPLLYRYPPGRDGLPGTEGAFLPCSFWLVQALALTGRADEARQLFSELVAYGGPLGLLPEEIHPATRAARGNFPQALTHAALVQAALALRDAGGGHPDRNHSPSSAPNEGIT